MLACYGDKKIGGPGLTVEIDESMFGGYADNFGISFRSDMFLPSHCPKK